MIGALYDVVKLTIIKLLVLRDYVERALWPIDGGIIGDHLGEQIPGTRSDLCIFAHFDRDNIIDDYVVYYLQALAKLGCETIVVTTAEELAEDEIRKALPFCRQFIIKRNIGYDFASWRTALVAVEDLSGYERVVVANDSVYGPLQDLGAVFKEMSHRDLSFWGITDSLRYGRHLQSYFMVFERPVLNSLVFRKFWKCLPDYRDKHVVIAQCEVGLSRRLAAAGFNFGAYNPVETVFENMSKEHDGLFWRVRGHRFNTTHMGWRILLHAGCPFLKVQLLRDNPKKLEGLANWDRELNAVSDYDTGLIQRHLKRVGAVR